MNDFGEILMLIKASNNFLAIYHGVDRWPDHLSNLRLRYMMRNKKQDLWESTDPDVLGGLVLTGAE